MYVGMTHDDYKARRKTVETPHGTFAYLDAGDGPPVVFVHGLLVSGYMWHQVIDALAGERRCVAYNLPHHGGTEVGDDHPLDLEANAEMLAAFCDALGLDAFDLVANDTGGAIAQAFALRHPERLRTLALTNCEARDWMPSHDDLAQMVQQLADRGELAPLLKAGHDDRAAARQGPFVATYQWPDRLTDDEIAGIQEPHQSTLESARRLERFFLALRPDQLVALEPGLRELRVPTALVWGTGDQIFPLHLAHWLRDTIPGAEEVVEIDGGKLFWPFERGPELAEQLRRHWQRASSSPARPTGAGARG
jgi:pimeloyl-ACP methyl ester carboxylesterase